MNLMKHDFSELKNKKNFSLNETENIKLALFSRYFDIYNKG